MRLLILCVIVFAYYACTIPKGFKAVNGQTIASNSLECQSLFLDIKNQWAIGYSEKCYYNNQKLAEKRIAQKECFIEQNIMDVVKMLGTPSYISEINYHYFMFKKCRDENFKKEEFHLAFILLDKTVKDVTYNQIAAID